MTEDEPWREEPETQDTDLFSLLAAAFVMLGVIWTVLGFVLGGLTVAAGILGVFLTLAVLCAMASAHVEGRS